MGSLSVSYAGEKTLETSTVITLDGVPNYTMGVSEKRIFEMITMTHLNKLAAESGAKVLTVEVRSQLLEDTSSTQSPPLERFLQATSSSLDVTTIVTGKHRPPPELNFDKLIEDSINADTGVQFEDALAKGSLEEGGEYFKDIEEIVAKPAPKQPTVIPTMAPTQIPSYLPLSSGGIGIGMSIFIVIGVALTTFGAVLGIFITRKRQREKSRQKSHNFFDHDDDDPLFFDVFSNKKQAIPHPHEVSFRGESGNRKSTSRRSIETEPMTSSDRSDPDIPYSTRQFPENDFDHNDAIIQGNGFSDGDLPIVRKDRMTRGGATTRMSTREMQSRQNSSRERNQRTRERNQRIARHSNNSRSHSNTSDRSHMRDSHGGSVVGSVISKSSQSNISQHSKFKKANGFYPPKRRSSTATNTRRLSVPHDIENEHDDRIRRKYYAKSMSDKQTKREKEDFANIQSDSRSRPVRHYSKTLKNEQRLSSSTGASGNRFQDKETNSRHSEYESDKSYIRSEIDDHVVMHDKFPTSFSDDEENVSIASMSTDSTISTKAILR